MGCGNVPLQGLADGRLELGGAVGVEPAQQGGDDGADIVAAHGGVGEQALAAGYGPDQPVLAAKAAGLTLVPGELGDVLGVLDAGRLVEAARMAGDDVHTVEDAHLVERRDHDEGAPHMGVRHAVIVEIEAGVGGLADGDLDPVVVGEGIAGQRDERAAFPLEGLAHGDGAVLGPGAATGDALAPGLGLGVEIVDIAPPAGGEEAVADIAYGPFDAPLGLGRRLPMIPPARPNYSG